MQQAQVPAQLVHLLSNIHRFSYFSMPGLHDVAHTHSGSKPGDPLGDIVFNMTMMILLYKCDQFFEITNLDVALPWAGRRTVLPSTAPTERCQDPADLSFLTILPKLSLQISLPRSLQISKRSYTSFSKSFHEQASSSI